MFPMPDLGDDLFYQPKPTPDAMTLHSDLQIDIFAPATIVDRKSKLPMSRINGNRSSSKTSKTSASEVPSSTSNNHDVADAAMFPTSDLGDDLFCQPEVTIDRKSKFQPMARIKNNTNPIRTSKTSASEGPSSTSNNHDVADAPMFPTSDSGDDLFCQPEVITVADRKSKLPMSRINNNISSSKTSETSASEGPSSTSNNHDVADAPMFPALDLGDDLFCQSEVTIDAMNLHSDLRSDIFAHATIVDRKSKFQPMARINNNTSPVKTSKTSASEGPSSTSNNHDVADAPMFPTSDLGDDLLCQSEVTTDALTLHSDLQTDIFASAAIVVADRKSKLPMSRINNNISSSKTSKTSASEGPSSTSNYHDVADAPMFSTSDLGDDLFCQPEVTTDEHVEIFQPELQGITSRNPVDPVTEYSFLNVPFNSVPDRKSKFQPMARINNNKSPIKTSKTSASEGPSSTSIKQDAAGDEHVEKFQLELQGIKSRNPVDPVTEYSHFDSLPMHNESIDAYVPNFSAGDLNESLENEDRSYFPIYPNEERACCGNSDDLNAQSLTEIEDLHTIDGEFKRDHIEESNFVECAPNIAQNDEAEKSPRKVRQRRKKLKINVDNVASIDQNTKINISEIDDDSNDDGCKDDDIPKQKKRKLRRKSTSRSSEHKRSIKNSNKNSEEPGSTVKDPPKKSFQHGTNRCKRAKRQVNKALLEIPDDELDRRQLVLRDLIRLAGYKERLSNKVAAVLKNSTASKSVGHEQGLNSEDANEEVRQEGPKLNYHSYMSRPLQSRWSKADTEIFYQAIRQFGTDFEMIQVLFPDKSRQQVKAKFKNEQRKHPLQISDALVHRGKDHSHFEKVIQHLQTMAEQNSKKDESDPTAQSQDEADQSNEKSKMEDN